ncbi:MAG: aminomethyl-transferring glycine dehydrogenase subunit GcvPB [Candidatus Bathyarchaeia archaeon]
MRLPNAQKPFRQCKWSEPLICELSSEGKVGHMVPMPSEEELRAVGDPIGHVPSKLRRDRPPNLPRVSEVEVLRHFVRLSQQNFGVDTAPYPLGSCTMKYNPKFCESLASSAKVRMIHPLQDERLVQGILQILYELSRLLCEITGMREVSLQPSAGAHGEFAGALMMRKYHMVRGEPRGEMLIPESAHGTNFTSAAMAGFKVVRLPLDDRGCIDMEALKSALSKRTAGIMITNPNTLGIFERDVVEICKIVHESGGLCYYDGANLNAILSKCRPGDMGFDIAHLNLHKTFATPHGGGGPGAGPIAVSEELEDFLPVPLVRFDGERYYFDYGVKHSIGRVRGFYGNIAVLVKAYAYILALGREGLREVSEVAVLNSNYLMRRILEGGGYELPYQKSGIRMHEFVLSAKGILDSTGVSALDIAKRLLDHGIHAPTIYFPPIVKEALMVEPTETESVMELDRMAEAFRSVFEEARASPELVKSSPVNTAVSRVDEVKASHPMSMRLSWRPRPNPGAESGSPS